MTSIFFWNTNKNENIDSLLVDAVVENDCDIIVLAEYTKDLRGLCNELSLYDKDFQPINIVGCERIKIASSVQYRYEMISDGDYHTIQNIKYLSKEILLVALHLPSKMFRNEEDQKLMASRIVGDIEVAEKQVAHTNTIIIGDFNANPFESACISAGAFHAVPNISVAKKRRRKVNYKEYKLFYNPMWNFFGDQNSPNGTYYYDCSGAKTYFWNIFDQVLFSPGMIKCFERDSLKIISKIKNTSLMNDKHLPNTEISDHLPIFFRIEEESI